jgi:hypothetical protein
MMVPAPQMAASEATIVAQKLCLDNSERSIALECYNTHIISNKHRYLHIVTIACPPSQRCNRPLHSRHHNHARPLRVQFDRRTVDTGAFRSSYQCVTVLKRAATT